MGSLDAGLQPHCPEDDVVMRDVPGGWECPECGHVQQALAVEIRPEFDDPDIHDG